ncbi:MAG: amidohydrolase, partial [Schwartzia sp.]|nr:amidohydrolase [Schwartzia sp. (in: firmicutes)]
AEEGVRGAKAMVDRGVVDDVDYMLGAHFGFQMKETGSVACNVTGFLATSKFDARFTGRASHAGAAPEAGRNALLAAACAALNLHAIPRHSGGVSRINVGVLEAGSGRNVTADKALIKLETRGGTSEIDRFMGEEARRVIEAAAQMYGVTVTIERVGGAAGGENSPALAAHLEQRAKDLGIFQKIAGPCDFGASEDYAYFMERVQQRGGQAAYILVGADLAAGHHDSRFNFDEAALPKAVTLLAASAAGLLLGEKV